MQELQAFYVGQWCAAVDRP